MATTHELIDRAVRLASHEGCTNGFVATTCREAQEPIQEYCTGCLLELIAKHLEDATDCAALRQQIAALRDQWREIGGRPMRPTGFIICADELDAVLASADVVKGVYRPDLDESRWRTIEEALKTSDLPSDLSRLAAISSIVNSRKPLTEAAIARAHQLIRDGKLPGALLADPPAPASTETDK
jgi:hypothetical protein